MLNQDISITQRTEGLLVFFQLITTAAGFTDHNFPDE